MKKIDIMVDEVEITDEQKNDNKLKFKYIPEFNFSIIGLLKGDINVLEFSFQIQKIISLNNGS
jgi:hypothetical protein